MTYNSYITKKHPTIPGISEYGLTPFITAIVTENESKIHIEAYNGTEETGTMYFQFAFDCEKPVNPESYISEILTNNIGNVVWDEAREAAVSCCTISDTELDTLYGHTSGIATHPKQNSEPPKMVTVRVGDRLRKVPKSEILAHNRAIIEDNIVYGTMHAYSTDEVKKYKKEAFAELWKLRDAIRSNPDTVLVYDRTREMWALPEEKEEN